MKSLKSSEAVGIGHPDKIADLIADSILDDLVSNLGINQTRFSGEVLVSAKKIFFAGEGSTYPGLDLWNIVSEVLRKLDYESEEFEFFEDYKAQSLELAELNLLSCRVAADQGIILGVASNQTEHYLPLEYVLSKEISLKITKTKQKDLKKDFKILLNIEKNQVENLVDFHLSSIIISIHHNKCINQEMLESYLKNEIVIPILRKYKVTHNSETQWLINPSGSFLIGGLEADSGVTNRKQVVDMYGAGIRHGGGGLSGKDLTKIDRLGAYYLRWIAKNIVASGLAREIEIKATFSIGLERALSFDITHSIGCSLKSSNELVDLIESCFPITVSEIFNYFSASTLSFAQLCEISHFGEFVPDLPWEKLNKVTDINEWAKRKFKDS